MKRFLIPFLSLLPRNLLSRLFGVVVSWEIPLFSIFIRNLFIRFYSINLDEIEKPLNEYASLQSFFVRKLKKGSRVLGNKEVLSPVDGKLVHSGKLLEPRLELVQVKGKNYTLESLVKDADLAEKYRGGSWATIYLAPWNYHRIHSPIDAEVKSVRYIPGTLWPVNEVSVQQVPDLFCVNERVITELEDSKGRKCLVVKVGATNVGKISLAFSNHLLTNTASAIRAPRHWEPIHSKIELNRGDELGCFEMGSTVVLVLDSKWSGFSEISSDKAYEVRMGENL